MVPPVNPVRDFRIVPSWAFGTVKFESQDVRVSATVCGTQVKTKLVAALPLSVRVLSKSAELVVRLAVESEPRTGTVTFVGVVKD